jgi:phosphoribosylformylglycinamidine (FGAM) synthase PurS component
MRYRVRVAVMPLDELRDPEGETVAQALSALGLAPAHGMRVGKLYQWDLVASDPQAARQEAERTAREILANPVSQRFEVLSVAPSEEGAKGAGSS